MLSRATLCLATVNPTGRCTRMLILRIVAGELARYKS